MSYDLLLEGPDLTPFRELMIGMPNVRPSDGGDGWCYVNDATGVYYTMNVDRVLEEEITSGEPAGPYVDCEINYLRPSFFMDEALPNILDYARRIGFTIRDPQGDGVPRSADEIDQRAVRERWLEVTRGWVRGEAAGLPFLDPAVATCMWRHNLLRDFTMNDAAQNPDGLFVPLIFAFAPAAEPRRVLTGIVLGQGVASVIPDCDLVVLAERRRIAGIEFGPMRRRFVRRAAVLEALRPLLDAAADAAEPRISFAHRGRAWKLLASLPSEPPEAYAQLAADGFVDVR